MLAKALERIEPLSDEELERMYEPEQKPKQELAAPKIALLTTKRIRQKNRVSRTAYTPEK